MKKIALSVIVLFIFVFIAIICINAPSLITVSAYSQADVSISTQAEMQPQDVRDVFYQALLGVKIDVLLLSALLITLSTTGGWLVGIICKIK